MKKTYGRFIALLGISLMWTACTKYGPYGEEEKIEVDVITMPVALAYADKEITFGSSFKSDSYTWYLDGNVVSTSSRYTYKPANRGKHIITLKINAGEYKCAVGVGRETTPSSSKWISEVYDYSPSVGQFINDESTGTLTAARSIVGGGAGMVSLGGFGGSITFGFDHTVANDGGYDFVIKGNAYEGSSEPAVVWVAFDDNANGQADAEEWYRLKGEDDDSGTTVKNYSVTFFRPPYLAGACDVEWEDMNGERGKMDADVLSAYHPQSYWPAKYAEEQTITRSGLRLTGLLENRSQGGEELWYFSAAGAGYADNFSPEYQDVVNMDNDTADSNKFDISHAVDADGKAVLLPGVDFIKVETAVHEYAGWVGELSTEVCGAISLTVK